MNCKGGRGLAGPANYLFKVHQQNLKKDEDSKSVWLSVGLLNNNSNINQFLKKEFAIL